MTIRIKSRLILKIQPFQRIPEKDYLVHLVFAIIKLSAASLKHPDMLATTTELYKDCYDYAKKTNQVNLQTEKSAYRIVPIMFLIYF